MSEAAYPARPADVPDSSFGEVQANHVGRRRQSVRDPSIFANSGQRAVSGGLPRRFEPYFGDCAKVLISLTGLNLVKPMIVVA